jgi:hypothetical protein
MAMKLVDSLARMYKTIDTNRLYIVGLSMGGWGTWDAIIRYPGKFAAAMPICGGGDTSKASRLVNMAIWPAVGSQDGTIPPHATRNLVAAIERHGKTWVKSLTNKAWTTGTPTRSQFIGLVLANPKPQFVLTEYTDGGHDVWTPLLNDTLVFPWIFSKSKASTSVKKCSGMIEPGQNYSQTRMTVHCSIKDLVMGSVARPTTRVYTLTGRMVGRPALAGKERSAAGAAVLIVQTK